MSTRTYTVTDSHRGKRLDLFIQHHEAAVSRSRIHALLEAGLALVNGRPGRPGSKVRPGDVVTLELPDRPVHAVLPEDIPLNVVFEDEHMVVLNKPPGLVVHPAPGNYTGTLVNALLFHYGSLPSPPPRPGTEDEEEGPVRERAGIVHRLDKDTSGILVVARTPEALSALSGQFHDRIVEKKYLALVAGVIKKGSGRIEVAIGRHVRERKKISVLTAKPRDAVSIYTVRERFAAATLVEVEIKTGRTHQIRVHLAHIGHPVLGDRVYGGAKACRLGGRDVLRQMLHAGSLSLLHPVTGHPMTFSAPPPRDMAELVEMLRGRRAER